MTLLNICTSCSISSSTPIEQYMRVCRDCRLQVCLNCASLCHTNHNLSSPEKISFICQCSQNECKATLSAPSPSPSTTFTPSTTTTAPSTSTSGSNLITKCYIAWKSVDGKKTKTILKVFNSTLNNHSKALNLYYKSINEYIEKIFYSDFPYENQNLNQIQSSPSFSSVKRNNILILSYLSWVVTAEDYSLFENDASSAGAVSSSHGPGNKSNQDEDVVLFTGDDKGQNAQAEGDKKKKAKPRKEIGAPKGKKIYSIH